LVFAKEGYKVLVADHVARDEEKTVAMIDEKVARLISYKRKLQNKPK